MVISEKSKKAGFWKIYGLVMAVDLLLYILIAKVRSLTPATKPHWFRGNRDAVDPAIFQNQPTTGAYRTYSLESKFL